MTTKQEGENRNATAGATGQKTCPLARLFGETVRQVNCRTTPRPRWKPGAAGEADLLTRDSWFQRLYTLVAEAGGRIVGYGNVEDTGYLDHLFVRWDCQGQGIAAVLCDALEAHCRELGVDAVTSTPPRPPCPSSSAGAMR